MTLRAMEPEDLELLYTIENNRDIWFVGTQTAPFSRYRLREYIANSEVDIYKDEQVRFVIEHDGDGVGIIDLFNFSPQHRRAELGIALLENVRGKGIARLAIRQIADYAREVIHLHQIYAIVPMENADSLRMLEACGFERVSEFKDWIFSRGKYQNAMMMQLFLC